MLGRQSSDTTEEKGLIKQTRVSIKIQELVENGYTLTLTGSR